MSVSVPTNPTPQEAGFGRGNPRSTLAGVAFALLLAAVAFVVQSALPTTLVVLGTTPEPLAMSNSDETPSPVALAVFPVDLTATATATDAATATATEVPSPTPEPPLYPLAVMVENIVDARPQSGLARADVVYEALVEGGITRFMAVYTQGQSDVIGPVRSARHYFVYLAAEYNAPYVHIGASFQGYEALSATLLINLDETYGDPGFWRVYTRYAPHNAYTSTDQIRSALAKVGAKVTPGGLAGFRFRDDSNPVEGLDAPDVRLVYPGGYEVEYVYLPELKTYRRYMEGLRQRDADTDEQVAPRNVVVQFVDSWVIDRVGRLDLEQLGEGKALFFRDGVVTEGFWQKPAYGNVTEWYDADWNPVLMNPGKTWVQIIPRSGKVAY